MNNPKSDVEAKRAFVKELEKENFKDIKIASSPADIIAVKNGVKNYFEIKFTSQKDKYFGAATLTEWECAINNLDNFLFVVCRQKDNKWIFDRFSPKEFIRYSTIPPFKIFFNLDLKDFDKKKSDETKALKASFDNLKELVSFYKKLKIDKFKRNISASHNYKQINIERKKPSSYTAEIHYTTEQIKKLRNLSETYDKKIDIKTRRKKKKKKKKKYRKNFRIQSKGGVKVKTSFQIFQAKGYHPQPINRQASRAVSYRIKKK